MLMVIRHEETKTKSCANVIYFQMYGEKVEEAEELRLDLSDVKEMYKIQIEELLRKSTS